MVAKKVQSQSYCVIKIDQVGRCDQNVLIMDSSVLSAPPECQSTHVLR